MLSISDLLRLLRKNNHSIDDINLCYNTATTLGYKDQNLIDVIETMLSLIKSQEHPSYKNTDPSHLSCMKDKLSVRNTLLEMQKIHNLFS